jgi:hypothetical protein
MAVKARKSIFNNPIVLTHSLDYLLRKIPPKEAMRKKLNSKGLTLVEILIAIAILVFTVVTILPIEPPFVDNNFLFRPEPGARAESA